MSSALFKSPPVVECLSREFCLGFGKKIHDPSKICSRCLRRHDPQQLRVWAEGNWTANLLIDEAVSKQQVMKRNVESRGRYLCAFEDPDFEYSRWRRRDLNLRDTRLNCSVVRRKGTACEKCWRRHLRKIGVVQYFSPTGLCHEEADRVASAERVARASRMTEEDDTQEKKGEGKETRVEVEDDDDVEGYNTILG